MSKELDSWVVLDLIHHALHGAYAEHRTLGRYDVTTDLMPGEDESWTLDLTAFRSGDDPDVRRFSITVERI